MGTLDLRLNELAVGQFGVVSRTQARQVGVDSDAIARRVRAGSWHDATGTVLVSASSPDTFERRATIGLLDAGARAGLSFDTALARYGVAGFELEPIHISRPKLGLDRHNGDVVLHESRYLPEHHLVVVNGLVTTTPARTLADLASVKKMHRDRFARTADSAWAMRLVTRPHLEAMTEEWCRRGRRGSTMLREYLESKPVDWVPPASNLARRFVHLITEAGMPEPRSEVNLGSATAWLGRVDCLDPELPLIAEIDSDRFHVAPLDAASDVERDEAMSAAGFEVERFPEFQVWHQPAVVVKRWRAARQRVRRGLS
jgi:hypothetical protein